MEDIIMMVVMLLWEAVFIYLVIRAAWAAFCRITYRPRTNLSSNLTTGDALRFILEESMQENDGSDTNKTQCGGTPDRGL